MQAPLSLTSLLRPHPHPSAIVPHRTASGMYPQRGIEVVAAGTDGGAMLYPEWERVTRACCRRRVAWWHIVQVGAYRNVRGRNVRMASTTVAMGPKRWAAAPSFITSSSYSNRPTPGASDSP